MTGRALFNEVFIDDARVPADNIIGGLNNGWAVTNTTLAAERASLGSGGGGAAGAAFPGPMAGHLERKAGEFVGQVRTGGTGGGGEGMTDRLIDLARDRQRTTTRSSARDSPGSTSSTASGSSRRCACAPAARRPARPTSPSS